MITTTPEDTEVVAGSDVTLHCDASTDPAEQENLKITWRRDGADIDFDDEANLSFDDSDNSLVIAGAFRSITWRAA